MLASSYPTKDSLLSNPLSASPEEKGRTKGIMAKKKMSELNQTHGKVEAVKPTTLDQIWGDTGLSKYKTLDEKQYTSQLDEMNRSDLQAHAISIGIIPIDNRETLAGRLLKEFRKHVSSHTVPNRIDHSAKVSKKALDILKEGK